MRQEKLIEFAIDLAYEGKEYEEIKKELKRKTNDSKSIDDALYAADHHIAEYQLLQQEKSKHINRMLAIAFVCVLGAALSFYADFLETRKFTISFGALLVGAWLFKREYDLYTTTGEPGNYKQSKFKRKRFIR